MPHRAGNRKAAGAALDPPESAEPTLFDARPLPRRHRRRQFIDRGERHAHETLRGHAAGRNCGHRLPRASPGRRTSRRSRARCARPKKARWRGVHGDGDQGQIDHLGDGDHRRSGPLQLPGRSARPRRLYVDDPGDRLRPRRQADRDRRGRADRDRRHQAQEDAQSRRPAHQRRMARELARHRRREAPRRRLHELPHARAHRALRTIRPRSGWQIIPRMLRYAQNTTPLAPQLRSGESTGLLVQQPERLQRLAEYLRLGQSERVGHVPLRAQDAQARVRQGHPRHHHHLQAAEADRPAPRRDGRSGRRRLFHLFRRSAARPARSQDRRGAVVPGPDPEGEGRQGNAEPRPRP